MSVNKYHVFFESPKDKWLTCTAVVGIRIRKKKSLSQVLIGSSSDKDEKYRYPACLTIKEAIYAVSQLLLEGIQSHIVPAYPRVLIGKKYDVRK